MTASHTPTPDFTTASDLAALVMTTTDLDELVLTEAAMGPVHQRNHRLVLALLTLLDAAGSLAEAIADNAIDTGKRVPDQVSPLADAAMTRIGRHLTIAVTWAESDALPALPQGHRLLTNLDAHQ